MSYRKSKYPCLLPGSLYGTYLNIGTDWEETEEADPRAPFSSHYVAEWVCPEHRESGKPLSKHGRDDDRVPEIPKGSFRLHLHDNCLLGSFGFQPAYNVVVPLNLEWVFVFVADPAARAYLEAKGSYVFSSPLVDP